MKPPSRHAVLLIRSGQRVCAIPIDRVSETMRPVAVSPLPGTEPFVRGAAVIRGEPVPVVDLQAFLGSVGPAPASRLVVVRCGARRAALEVEGVIGVAELAGEVSETVPLLAGAAAGAVDGIRTRDRELLLVLDAARLVPERAWQALVEGGTAA